MKRSPFFRIILAISILIAASACFASGVYGYDDKTDHTPRDFDHLNPAVSYSPHAITSIDCEKCIVSFIPDLFSTDNSGDVHVYADGDTISYVQFATKHRFLINSDTLSYIGFENRATQFSIDKPFTVLKLAPINGDTINTEWAGKVIAYGNTVLKATRGTSKSYSDYDWRLVTDKDSLNSVTRVVWDLDMEYINPDSIPAGIPDSIAAEAVSDLIVDIDRLKSERLLTRRILWFANNARYPALQQSSVSRILIRKGSDECDTIPVSQICMYYPAAWQYTDTGEEQPQQSPAYKSRGSWQDSENKNETILYANEPITTGDIVTLTASSANGKTDATITLYSDSGLCLSEPVTITLTTIPSTVKIPVPLGWKGVLLIRIEANTYSLTRKVVV